MGNTINFIFGCHSHQPVGNFDHVFKDAYEKAYRPFLDVLERYPDIKVTHHYSGPLLDWIEQNQPEFLDRLADLVKAGQVEIMGGGYYEPLLCAIPERDAIDQIKRMNIFCEKHFGQAPKGMWLTERVWEPHMPRTLAQAGIEYTALDDAHFLCSGLTPQQMFGYYITEDEGHAIKVFPILEKLRYFVPFHQVHETIEYLRQNASEDGTRCAVIHDDGEKFGVWPGTHKSVYGEGWLEQFFQALTDNKDWIKSVTYSEYIEKANAIGRTYLTCASYHEMMAWALPTEMQRRLKLVEDQIRENPDRADEHMLFVRGGFWRNFLAKYDESNNIQKKMLRVSNRIDRIKNSRINADNADLERAAKLLHQGQCNCAYWHGVFGGLYLNHLRTALYEKLIESECILDKIEHEDDKWIVCDVVDFDTDGHNEVVIENSMISLGINPIDGGTIFELDYKVRPFNFNNVLTRREEPYHDDLHSDEVQIGDVEDSEVSIHNLTQAKETGLESFLIYDPYRRASTRDHFISDDTTAKQLWEGSYTELGDFVTGEYSIQMDQGYRMEKKPVSVHMTRMGYVQMEKECLVKLIKAITISPCASTFEIQYDIHNESEQELKMLFGTEFAVNMLTGSAPDRYYRSDERDIGNPKLGKIGCDESLGHFALRDEWLGVEYSLTLDEVANIYRFATETVSQSEGGQERVYQGSVIVPCWPLHLAPGAHFARNIVVGIERLEK